MRKYLFLLAALFIGSLTYAQINIKDKIKQKTLDRIDQKVDEGIDKGLDKAEEGIGESAKKEKESDQVDQAEESTNEKQSTQSSPTAAKPKLESYTQYDFVPGDKILYFEDFSQDAIGDFPANWTTNGSGEVKTVNIATGRWLHMNAADAVYCYMNKVPLSTNFIVEFDVIADDEFNEYTLTLYEDNEENQELNSDLYPGNKGLHITVGSYFWQSKGYNNIDNANWLEGRSEIKPVIQNQANHVIIWVQNRRVRIYHQGSKCLDLPTNIHTGTKFDRLLFTGWSANSKPYISNIKITTAAPDTRSKLITEGKLISYGINFDSGKDVVKPESYGAIKEIATVLKENPTVKVKIVGHTDSDGDDAANLDLSKRRAISVKNVLASQFQIDASRLETDGKGETQPLENNGTVQGKARNRRVEFLKM